MLIQWVIKARVQNLVDDLLCTAETGDTLRRTIDEQVMEGIRSVNSQVNLDQARNELASAQKQLDFSEISCTG